MNDKHIIWSDLSLDFEHWKLSLMEEFPDKTIDELIPIMYERNVEYLEEERINLNIQLPRPILVIADLGLWNGRHSGYAVIESGNIKDCLYSSCDSNEWYVDKRGNLCCTAVHHDGTNHYLYRGIKDRASDSQVERLQNKIYNGTATRADITNITRRLGDDIAKVYGFSIPRPSQQEIEL